MGLRTPEQYKASLKDGREVYYRGEQVQDVTTHPIIGVAVEHACIDYRMAEDPRYRDLAVVTDPQTGESYSRYYLLPRNTEDLLKRSQLIAASTREGATLVVLIKEIGTDALYALHIVAEEMAKRGKPEYKERVEKYYRMCRERDYGVAVAQSDVKGDRGLGPQGQEHPDYYLRIVDRRADGIVVRGAKIHTSVLTNTDEVIVLPTRAMKAGDEDYSVAFAVPAATKGLKLIASSYGGFKKDPFEYPISAKHKMMETITVFDDVFVPWDRVFLAGEAKLAGVFARALGLWERTLGMVEAAERAEILVGAALLVSEQQGKGADAHVQEAISELVCYAQMIRMALEWSCRNFERTPSGMVHPSILGINVGKYYFAANYHTVLRYVHDLGGGLVLTLPKRADLENPESGKYLRKYLHTTADVDVEERMRIYNLIRDLTADAYGGWHLVTTLQAGGGLAAQRVMMNRSFDLAAARAKARRAAGVEG